MANSDFLVAIFWPPRPRWPSLTNKNVKIIGVESNPFKRKVKEAIYIKTNDPELNQNVGKFNLPLIYDQLRTGGGQDKLVIHSNVKDAIPKISCQIIREWSGSMASTVFTHHVILYIVILSCQSFWLNFLTRKVERSKVLVCGNLLKISNRFPIGSAAVVCYPVDFQQEMHVS